MKGKGEAKSRVRRPTHPAPPTSHAGSGPIAPGQGTIIVELNQGELTTIDLAAFLDALHKQGAALQNQAQFLMADTWQEMVGVALREASS